MACPPLKLQDYVVCEKIGSGGYADVYKAYKKKAPSEVVAIKAVQRASLSPGATDSLITEIRLLKNLKHDHIVQLKDFMCDENYIYIIMEHCNGGDLSHFIRSRHRLPETACQRFLQQLAAALFFIRQQNIAHFDLKPQNILLQSRRNPVVKIGDFGLAQHLPDSCSLSKVMGSPLYMAPEILLKNKYDAKVDLWSVGVILYECLFGKAPYSSSTMEELIQKIKNGTDIQIPHNSSISVNCRDLLTRCLQRDPDKRIEFEEFFKHPFVDLEHKPCKESMDKARALLHKAVEHDGNEDYEAALRLYTDSLLYLVPHIYTESNYVHRAALRRQAEQYLNRTEKLKQILRASGSSDAVAAVAAVPALPSTNREEQALSNDGTLQLHNRIVRELLTLTSTTPSMTFAIEVAQAAECYQREGSHHVALQKYELALGKLLELMTTEPLGRRRTLLMTSIQYWITQAEKLKEMLDASKPVHDDISAVSTSGDRAKTKSVISGKRLIRMASNFTIAQSKSVEALEMSENTLLSESDYDRHCSLQ